MKASNEAELHFLQVKVSGPVILANGLDQAIEISLFPYSSLGAIKTTLPSRGVGPTFLYSIQDIEHFRLRFVSCNTGNVQNPWSDIIYTDDLVKAEGSGPVSSILVACKCTQLQEVICSLYPEHFFYIIAQFVKFQCSNKRNIPFQRHKFGLLWCLKK